MNIRFNHRGIQDSLMAAGSRFDSHPTKGLGEVLVYCLEMFCQANQALLSIACELQRFNDREEAKDKAARQ